MRRSPVDGLPVSVKDLFDVAGDVTRAGSKVLTIATAKNDAPAVARLRAAGAVFVGRTNMVEFAFGGVGINPHYGTPKNPWDRETGRVPGGSSSGAAVAQADGMCVMALGTDTRGSVRIPAALCGVTGFKPTARRVPREGAFPLSYTLDSIGPLANSVACCAAYDAMLAGEAPDAARRAAGEGAAACCCRARGASTDLDPEVEQAFERALEAAAARRRARQREAGARVRPPGRILQGRRLRRRRGLRHPPPCADRIGEYDPRVAKRVLLGKDLSAADYVELRPAARRSSCARSRRCCAPFDAFLMPTVPCVAPTIAEAERERRGLFPLERAHPAQ